MRQMTKVWAMEAARSSPITRIRLQERPTSITIRSSDQETASPARSSFEMSTLWACILLCLSGWCGTTSVEGAKVKVESEGGGERE